MNYRHAFHAGNIGDVLKHAVLARVLNYLKKKPAGFRVIDTHAGTGRYDLIDGDARRTGEWRHGIGRIHDQKLPPELAELLAPWLDTVRKLNEETPGELRSYPGSPLLARMLLRKQDRLTATELHPRDHADLASLFAGDHQVKAIALDGWMALGSFLPPKEKRGLVLIDPPFEATDEFDKLATGLVRAWRRWRTGVYLAWFPIKDRKRVNHFYQRLRDTGMTKVIAVEHQSGAVRPDGPMVGSGLVAINPPWVLRGELELLLPWLTSATAQGPDADYRIIELVGEQRAQ